MDHEPRRILDIGTGTGLLALMLAQVTERAAIEAVEVNHEAYAEAQLNFRASRWSERMVCHHQAIQTFQPTEKYELIICNPPYFAHSMEGVNQHKNQALHASTLSQQDLLQAVTNLLSNKGLLFLIYPPAEMDEFLSLARKKSYFQYREVTVRNHAEAPIFRKMACLGAGHKQPVCTNINIRTKEYYTREFWGLLKDYYLEYNNPFKEKNS